MRAVGGLLSSRGPTVSDHACRGYASLDERAAVTCAWLRDAQRLGQRAVYVADAPHDELVAELDALPGLEEGLATGALVVLESKQAYDLSRPIDPEAQLALYAGAVDQAIADGYDGVRVVADITPLVADPARRASHLHWEQFADRYISEHPLAPLCLYDRRTISGIDAIICVHALQEPPAPFALYGRGADEAGLAGEVDTSVAEAFDAVLAGLPVGDRVLDLSGLSFLDVHNAWRLEAEVRRRRAAGHPLALRAPSELVRRVWQVLGCDESQLATA